MSIIEKPMLACSLEDLTDKNIELVYPMYATPKLDGIRSLMKDNETVSRKFKLIPNKHIRQELNAILSNGCDGEILSGKTFQECSSAIMAFEGEPEFVYYLFDYVKDDPKKAYLERMKDLEALVITDPRVVKLLPVQINNKQELDEYETKCLDEGYEGIMLRSGTGGYKFGRSTPKQQWLIKIKRFVDSEAIILGFEAKTTNTNEKKTNALGHSERSTAKAGMIECDTLGTLLVKDVKSGVEFRIGSGFDDTMRKHIWDNRDKYLNQFIKYKCFEQSGKKDKPRFPIAIGFRHPDDM